jgi:hypothetical protein
VKDDKLVRNEAETPPWMSAQEYEMRLSAVRQLDCVISGLNLAIHRQFEVDMPTFLARRMEEAEAARALLVMEERV